LFVLATVFTYNTMNEVETVTNPRTGQTITYYYDPLRRLKQVIQPGSATTNYGYDPQGILKMSPMPQSNQQIMSMTIWAGFVRVITGLRHHHLGL
jgi:YD repeat-containing protein